MALDHHQVGPARLPPEPFVPEYRRVFQKLRSLPSGDLVGPEECLERPLGQTQHEVDAAGEAEILHRRSLCVRYRRHLRPDVATFGSFLQHELDAIGRP